MDKRDGGGEGNDGSGGEKRKVLCYSMVAGGGQALWGASKRLTWKVSALPKLASG